MRTLLLVTIFLLIIFSSGFAQEEKLRLVAEGKYFSIYGDRHLDILSLLKTLDFDYFLHIENTFQENEYNLNTLLADTLDALYLEVSDILEIHIYSYHGKIYFLPDRKNISSIVGKNFNNGLNSEGFYWHQKNAIYISTPDLTLGMLGHEIAHAIISHYFVVPPSTKVQEILAGYVEYRLRKQTGSLPQQNQ
ncbi:MAG: hypothetical protein DRQ24_10120 [Candidatus Latescibacterota bacterium]|nr:MAG: hypothetical protein DRQ24_10120 [Candidatus Latescibacterota bacterium]